VLIQTTAATPQQRSTSFRVLAFTKTAGFRHESIPAALQALRELGARNGFTVDATEDPAAFTDANLSRYAVVAFVLTTGDVLDDARQAAFERYIHAGHGFVGVHSAADTEHDWPWYGRLVGAYFKIHPAIQRATVRVATTRHPSTAGLPRSWARTDEWYNFARNPRPDVRVLATLSESSYSPGPGAMGADHPIAWAHSFEGGRAWYTRGGHTEESYAEPLFRRHVLGGIRYAAGLSPPAIRSVRVSVRSRRVHVSVRYSACRPCRGRLLAGSKVTPLGLRDGRATATSGVVPKGRQRVTVSLEDPLTGLRASTSRAVVVR
jgi:cytochrome c